MPNDESVARQPAPGPSARRNKGVCVDTAARNTYLHRGVTPLLPLHPEIRFCSPWTRRVKSTECVARGGVVAEGPLSVTHQPTIPAAGPVGPSWPSGSFPGSQCPAECERDGVSMLTHLHAERGRRSALSATTQKRLARPAAAGLCGQPGQPGHPLHSGRAEGRSTALLFIGVYR